MVSSGSTDFGGSEVPLNDEELAKFPTKLLLLPSVVGGVVPIYNLPGIRQELRIASEVLAGIYLGTIRNWICRKFGLRQTTRGTQKRGIGHRRKTVIPTRRSEENENTFG